MNVIYCELCPFHVSIIVSPYLQVTDHTCPILEDAKSRYLQYIKHKWVAYDTVNRNYTGDGAKRSLNQLLIKLTDPCEEYPVLHMVESCKFSFSQDFVHHLIAHYVILLVSTSTGG